MKRFFITVGQEKPGAPAQVLYVGDDGDAARKALEDAGNARKVFEGGVIRNPAISWRKNFEHLPELAAKVDAASLGEKLLENEIPPHSKTEGDSGAAAVTIPPPPSDESPETPKAVPTGKAKK